MRTKRTAVAVAAASAATALLTQFGVSPASAETQTGWIGGTAPTSGTVYLHSSTINNVPRPLASSVVYTSFGTNAPANAMGAKARLFKEGALCAATDYVLNSIPRNSQSAAISRDCGSGFYNSHGFVEVFDGTNYDEYVTFPTNSVSFTSPLARVAAIPELSTTSVNDRGQTLGSAKGVESDADLPDLVQAVASNGAVGYVTSADLASSEAGSKTGDTRSVNVYAADGTTTVGSFDIKTG